MLFAGVKSIFDGWSKFLFFLTAHLSRNMKEFVEMSFEIQSHRILMSDLEHFFANL